MAAAEVGVQRLKEQYSTGQRKLAILGYAKGQYLPGVTGLDKAVAEGVGCAQSIADCLSSASGILRSETWAMLRV